MGVRLVGFVLLVSTGFAGEAELAVERGQVLYRREAYDAARDLALEALRTSPTLADAHRLYVESATAAGLGARAVADLDGIEPVVPAHADAFVRVREAVGAGIYKTIKTETAAARGAWPTVPDVVEPLWSSADPKVAKLRASIVEDWTDAEALQAADAQTLLATSRVLEGVGETAARAVVDSELRKRGERVAPDHPPLGRVERTELARQLSKAPVTQLPDGAPSEVVDVVARLDEIWTLAGKHRDVAAVWRLAQRESDDSLAWSGEATALLRAGDLDAAAAAADAALRHAAAPRSIDVGASNADRQRIELATAFLARARVDEARGLLVEATVDLATAHLLAGRNLDDKLGERLETAGTALQRSIASKWTARRGTSTDAALAAAASTKDATARRAIVYEALFLASASSDGTTALARTPEPYVDVWVRAWLLAAAGEEAAGRIENARTDAVLATVLAGVGAQAQGWAKRAAFHQQAEEPDAAFVAFAVARGHGVTGLESSLEATYVGPGSWTKAADLVGGPPPATPLPGDKPPLAKPADTRRSLAVGSTFPPFSVSSRYGTLSNSSLRGKVVVFSFFDTSCGECLQMLPALGRMARTLRDEGRDVVVIGVSTDEDQAAFDDVFRVGEHWAELVRAPSLGEKVGVHKLPTTWVVDGQGIARYGVDHWLPTAAIEAQVRELAH